MSANREILSASSAPGISRHHWGTDFDLFDPDMNPAEWQAGGAFADEYSWMMHNASTYGFIQPFTPTSTFMTGGYIEERWHWSYYPAAQALLEFARQHQADIETRLMAEWGSDAGSSATYEPMAEVDVQRQRARLVLIGNIAARVEFRISSSDFSIPRVAEWQQFFSPFEC